MQPLISSPQSLLENRNVRACIPSPGRILLISQDKEDTSLEVFELKKEIDRVTTISVIRACEAPTTITASEFIFNSHIKCYFICAGFSDGGITIYSTKGEACLTFNFLPQAPVLYFCSDKLRFCALHGGNVVGVASHEVVAAAMTASESNFNFRLYKLESRKETKEIACVETSGNLIEVFDTQKQWALLAVGIPFISLHVIEDDGISLRDIVGGGVRGVFNLAKSMVWGKSTESNHPGGRRPTAASKSLEFMDTQRKGIHLSPSRTKNEILVTDTFGRVTLFCKESVRCLWMWKGYRDAQVANTGNGMLIHAPRRGLLEFWMAGVRTKAWIVKPGTLVEVAGGGAPETIFLHDDGQIEQISIMLDDVESFDRPP